MSTPFDLKSSRVVVVGLGLMGGAFALALQGHCAELAACDPDPKTVELARQKGIAKQVELDPASVLPGADLILLAAPVRAILTLIEGLPELHMGEAVVIDIGSTKKQICEAMHRLPDRFDPLGGHPMCGKAVSGLQHAEADLYRNATFAFTPLQRTGKRAMSAGEQIAHALGALPLWIDAETHDRWVAATSHLPYLLSLALTLATPVEALPLVGPGFLSTSRLAGSSITMMGDVLMTNRENLVPVLEDFLRQIQAMHENLSREDFTELLSLMQRGANRHATLTSAGAERQAR